MAKNSPLKMNKWRIGSNTDLCIPQFLYQLDNIYKDLLFHIFFRECFALYAS